MKFKTGYFILGTILSVVWFCPTAKAESNALWPPTVEVDRLAFVTNRDSNDIAVIDTVKDAVVARISLGEFAAAHMAMPSADGKKLLVSATGRNRFLVIDLETLAIERSIQTGAAPEHFGLSPDQRFAYVGNMADASISLIDLETGAEHKRLTGFPEPHGFAFSPKSGKVYVSSFALHEVRSIDPPTQSWAKRHPVGTVHRAGTAKPEPYQSGLKGVAHPTLSIDGRTIYAADGDAGEVAVIDAETDQRISTLRVGRAPWRAYAAPDGKSMWVLNNGDRSISIISTLTQQVVATLKGGSDMTGVNFVQGGAKAYVISRGEGRIYAYDAKTLKPLNFLDLGKQATLETAATSADGRKIYVASSSEGAVYAIDGVTDEVKRIANVGRFPWGLSIWGAASENYCH